MTEADWLTGADPTPMLEFLRNRASDRKLRLFACACCRNVLGILDCKQCEEAVNLAEHIAEGVPHQDQMLPVLAEIQEMANSFPPAHKNYQGMMGIVLALWAPTDQRMFSLGFDSLASAVAWNAYPGATVVEDDWASPHDPEYYKVRVAERKSQANVLRDIFGNPFRPTTLDLRWLTATVIDLATAVYQEKAFDRMGILGDALMDVGCDGDEIIGHCRGEGVHVRGCWAIDLLLGKD